MGNRLFLGVEGRRRRAEFTVGLQYVQFGGLPENAIGPGPLGAGGAYFQHAGRSDSRQLYLRTINVRLKDVLPGLDLQLGRMGYTSGAEAASGVPKIEAVKRQRLDSRLLGEFEWSLYQRTSTVFAWIGREAPARLTASAFHPTQGGFEDAAGVSIDDLTIVSGVATLQTRSPIRGAEWQVFSHYYDDTRVVTARPDNTGHAAGRADVQVTTIGTSVVGACGTPQGRSMRSAGSQVRGARGTDSHTGRGRWASRRATNGRRPPGSPGSGQACSTHRGMTTQATLGTGRSSRCCPPFVVIR